MYIASSFLYKLHFPGFLANWIQLSLCEALKGIGRQKCSAEKPGYLLFTLFVSSGVPEEDMSSLLGAPDSTEWLWLLTLITPHLLFLLPLLATTIWMQLISGLTVRPFISYQAFAASSHIKFSILNYPVWALFLADPRLRHVLIVTIWPKENVVENIKKIIKSPLIPLPKDNYG